MFKISVPERHFNAFNVFSFTFNFFCHIVLILSLFSADYTSEFPSLHIIRTRQGPAHGSDVEECRSTVTPETFRVHLRCIVHTHIVMLSSGPARAGHQVSLVLLSPARVTLSSSWDHNLQV